MDSNIPVLGWVRRCTSTAMQKCGKPSWILFFVLSAFVLGVLAHSFIETPLPTKGLLIFATGLILISIIGVFPLFKGRFKGVGYLKTGFLCLMLAVFFLGLARYSISFPSEMNSIALFANRQVRIQGTIVNDPRSTGKSQEVILDELLVNKSPTRNKLIAWIPTYPKLSYGQVISFKCKVQHPEPIEQFRYDRYLLQRGVVATCFSYDEPFVLPYSGGSKIRSLVYDLRGSIESNLEQTMPEPHASLAAGLLLGVKRLPDHVDDQFRTIGLSHVIAASGYNVGLVISILLGGLTYYFRRQKVFWFLLLMVVLYVLLAGAEAAVVRAGLMGITVLVARYCGQQTSARNLLMLVAVVMLLVNPRLLRDDVGFQLSMLATTGLVALADPIGLRLRFLPEVFGVRQAFASTLAAITATLPIMFWSFGSVSLIAPIANLLILPLVPFAMSFAALAAGLLIINQNLGLLFGGLAWAVEQIIFWFTKVLSAIPIASVTVNSILPLTIASIFFTIAISIYILSLPEPKKAL